jgi:hypothetical protein
MGKETRRPRQLHLRAQPAFPAVHSQAWQRGPGFSVDFHPPLALRDDSETQPGLARASAGTL